MRRNNKRYGYNIIYKHEIINSSFVAFRESAYKNLRQKHESMAENVAAQIRRNAELVVYEVDKHAIHIRLEHK